MKRETSMTAIRELSLTEVDTVAGATCIQVYKVGLTGDATAWAVIPCPKSATEQYIDAFLKGVEQGRKGQKT